MARGCPSCQTGPDQMGLEGSQHWVGEGGKPCPEVRKTRRPLDHSHRKTKWTPGTAAVPRGTVLAALAAVHVCNNPRQTDSQGPSDGVTARGSASACRARPNPRHPQGPLSLHHSGETPSAEPGVPPPHPQNRIHRKEPEASPQRQGPEQVTVTAPALAPRLICAFGVKNS